MLESIPISLQRSLEVPLYVQSSVRGAEFIVKSGVFFVMETSQLPTSPV